MKKKLFLNQLVYEKSSPYVVKFRALKTLYLLFQHNLFFDLVKVLFKKFQGLWRSVKIRKECESENVFDLAGLRKLVDTLSNFELKNSLFSVST